MKRRNLSYAHFADRLATIGIKDTSRNIQNKLTRGDFKSVFFLQVMEAIGVKNLQLDSGE
jgi:hypothetical protein